MGEIIGGLFAVYLLAALIEWAVVKRFMDDARWGGVVSAGLAYIVAVIAYGFGAANGNGWEPSGTILYLPGAIAVAIWHYARRDPPATDWT